ncbi:hypothetical protein H0A36_05640 [Endozoicomonas sp. SM1973]|uniref:Uncharacterized protein n=1 Tax=Spartinivicinus marinus TaxID=2994442 RepID=A0A853I8C1_9GAMM|nr:hypothetical protein [Spartinivicinus marinus]MCX4028932.1 hypothetical protein [Spartinivicinus marinus]NYZ65485.1 hypothetical protein [Spartinivicinus marinus]
MNLYVVRRRLAYLLVLGLLLVGTQILLSWFNLSMPSEVYCTGWGLLAVMGVLASYHWRKKLLFLNVGGVRYWLRLHILFGVYGVILFFIHINFSWPKGLFNQLIAAAFLLEVGSGLLGLYLSRTMPPRMTWLGERLLYEKMPEYYQQLRQQAEDLALQAAAEHHTDTLVKFYNRNLQNFLLGAANFWLHVFNSGQVRSRWALKFEGLQRYLVEDELPAVTELRILVFRKIELDKQYAIQGLLRRWLFLHIPLAYALFIFVLAHVMVIHSFSGV